MITCSIQPAHLIGRHADALIADLMDESMRDEMFAIDDALHAQAAACSLTLAPSRNRTLAVDLVATASAMCAEVAEIEALVRIARDWLDGLGDLAAAAQAHQAIVDAAELIENRFDFLADDAPAMEDVLTDDELVAMDAVGVSAAYTSRFVGISGGMLQFQIEDAKTLIVTTITSRNGAVVLGAIDVSGDDREAAAPAPVPEMAA